MQIFVNSVTPEWHTTLHVSGNTTIEEVKVLIQDKEGIRHDQQRLFFCGTELENRRTLRSYFFVHSTIHLVLRGLPGALSRAPDVEHMSIGQTVSGGQYRHYITYNGLSYAGKCRNPQCDVKGQMVSFNRGFGDQINVLRDLKQRVNVCPVCGKPFRCSEMLLNQCDAQIKYRKGVFDKDGAVKIGELKVVEYAPRGSDYKNDTEQVYDDYYLCQMKVKQVS